MPPQCTKSKYKTVRKRKTTGKSTRTPKRTRIVERSKVKVSTVGLWWFEQWFHSLARCIRLRVFGVGPVLVHTSRSHVSSHTLWGTGGWYGVRLTVYGTLHRTRV